MRPSSLPEPPGRRLFRALLLTFFWLGIAMCAWALSNYASRGREILQTMTVGRLMTVLLLMSAAWLLAVQGWRAVVRSAGVQPLPLRDAARHLALLLIGKYIPGGVWGFAARLGDASQNRPPMQMLIAGLADQWLGIFAIVAVSAAIWLSVEHNSAWPIALLLLSPIAATYLWTAAGNVLIPIMFRVLPRLRVQHAREQRAVLAKPWLLAAAGYVTGQVLVQMVTVAVLTHWMFNLSLLPSLDAAAFYGMGIAIGMVALFAPGGMLIREGAFVALSSTVIPAEQALVLAAALRLVFTGFDLLAGLLVLVWKLGD